MTRRSAPGPELPHAPEHHCCLRHRRAACHGKPTRAVADYPNQTIKIVVPFPPGGGVDVVARVIAPRLSELLGQSVIVENRAGAGASIGATFVAQAPRDGYTLLIGTASTHGTNPTVYAKLGI